MKIPTAIFTFSLLSSVLGLGIFYFSLNAGNGTVNRLNYPVPAQAGTIIGLGTMIISVPVLAMSIRKGWIFSKEKDSI